MSNENLTTMTQEELEARAKLGHSMNTPAKPVGKKRSRKKVLGQDFAATGPVEATPTPVAKKKAAKKKPVTPSAGKQPTDALALKPVVKKKPAKKKVVAKKVAKKKPVAPKKVTGGRRGRKTIYATGVMPCNIENSVIEELKTRAKDKESFTHTLNRVLRKLLKMPALES